MRLHRKNAFPALATAGALAALGITALPMLPVWLAADDVAHSPTLAPSFRQTVIDTPQSIVVDLNDNVSDGDIRDINTRYGLNLRYNSPEAQDDKLMIGEIPAGRDDAATLNALKADGRVEVAEPEQMYSIPETSPGTERLRLLAATTRFVSDDVRADAQTENTSNTVIRVTSTSYTALPFSPLCTLNATPVPPRPREISGEYRAFSSLSSPFTSRYSPWTFKPNDPRYSEQWNLQMVDVEGAWKHTRGKGAVVAVIDTGVSGTTSKRGKACRDFGQTSFTDGYDFVHNDKDPYDDHGHGTHVAGTIAESTNNNEGVAGIAFDATIMPIKVLSASGSGSAADIADAIRFAADKGADVINMSLGSAYPSDVIHNACKYARKKGVTIVCAAGNSFKEGVGYPAAYPECIAVSSVGPSGQLAKYSSYGKQVALAAPGGDMIDSGNPADGILQNTNFPESQGGKGDDYYAFQGTSMASPHVAGVAALIEAQGIHDPAKVRDILTKSATPAGDKNKYGAGILSASRAVEKASENERVKLRHLLLFGVGFLLLSVGGKGRLFGIRAAMVGALALGFFGPDWFTNAVGADSAWNLVGFSAIVPIALYALLRNGRGVKVAGVLGLATGVGLWANLHNDTLPFTTATFGQTPMFWVAANILAALAVGMLAARRAHRATNPVRD